MKLSRKWILVAALVLSVAIATSGTLAYLTDREGEANVFTFGNVDIKLNEDFEQGAKLVPGVKVEKAPSISNVGQIDAWVWATIAIPAGLDSENDASRNVLHFNYETDFVVPTGYWNWKNADGAWNVKTVENFENTGLAYNVYTVLYEIPLKVGETTLVMMTQAYLDTHIDITPDGKMYWVENGQATDLNWNVNEHGAPTMYIAAYAIQVDGFDTVQDAYAAYVSQWGENGGVEYTGATVVNVSDVAGLKEAIAAQNDATIILKDGEYTFNQIQVAAGKNITISGSKNAVVEGQFKVYGTLNLAGITMDDPDAAVAGEQSQFSKTAIAVTSAGSVTCTGVTFNQNLNDGTAITTWWDSGAGTSITVKNCTFNSNGQRPIRATGHVTVENCTFNDPYRYAVQLTAKNDTATLMDKAIINFNNNTIVDGVNGKALVYGIQLEGADYGCYDCVINGAGNKIEKGGAGSTMYYCECGKVDHATITWNTEVSPVHAY